MSEILLSGVTLSYPHVFQKKQFPGGGAAKYSAQFLLHKEKHKGLIDQIKRAILDLTASAYSDKKCPSADRLCLRDGDTLDKPEAAGHFVLSASENSRPVVVDQKLSPITEEDDLMYGGAVVNARVNLWAQNNNFGRRINANLRGIQFVKHGDRLGSGRSNVPADQMFGEVPTESDADESPFG